MTALPAAARTVIIGGGVMGTSVAYHLAAAGVPDVVLVERDTLAAGSTSRAAGGVRAQFSDELNIQLGQRSLAAFARFGEEPGYDIGLHRAGYLFLLSTRADLATFETNVALQNGFGVPSRLISPAEAHRLSPLISTDGLVGAAFSPDDGYCTPEAVVHGYAAGARRHGATVVRQCDVLDIETRGDEIAAVRTSLGRIRTGSVICAAGAWSRHVGAMVGVELPVSPVRRQIAVTEAVPDLPPDVPMTIDFTSTFYFHGEGRGLLMGIADPAEEPGFRTTAATGGCRCCPMPCGAGRPRCSMLASRAAGPGCTRSRRITTR
jgi:sarcosine oxidase subunit beta